MKEAFSCSSVLGGRGDSPGQFSKPTCIVIGDDETMYVCDCDNDRIQCFAADGSVIRLWGSRGSGDGQFRGPDGITIGIHSLSNSILMAMQSVPILFAFPPGLLPICMGYVGEERIYVSDSNNHRIQVFDRNGGFIRKWGTFGRGDGQFSFPRGIAVAPNGHVYVCDYFNNRIQCFDSEDRFLYYLGSGFERPISIATTRTDDIYVLEDNGIHCYHAAPGTFPNKVYTWTDAAQPRITNAVDMVVDKKQRVFIAGNSSAFLTALQPDPSSTHGYSIIGCYDRGGRIAGGLAIGQNGYLYVADAYNHYILTIHLL